MPATSSCTRAACHGAGERSESCILQRLADASKPFATVMEIKGEAATITVTGR
jgi:hypothetical protein